MVVSVLKKIFRISISETIPTSLFSGYSLMPFFYFSSYIVNRTQSTKYKINTKKAWGYFNSTQFEMLLVQFQKGRWNHLKLMALLKKKAQNLIRIANFSPRLSVADCKLQYRKPCNEGKRSTDFQSKHWMYSF